MKLLKKVSNDFSLFSIDERGFNLLDKILNKEFVVHKEYKNDKRTYVAKVEMDGNNYLLKVFYPRTVLKKMMTFVKKGESLKTLENITFFREKGVKELVPCIGSMEKREKGVITEEVLLMEFCEGRRPKTVDDFQKTINVLGKIFDLGRYHGDCNLGNFLIDENGDVRVIDTKLKKMYFGNYRRHFDFLVLKKYLPKKIEYPYNKNIFYLFAVLVRKIRDKKNDYHEKKGEKNDSTGK